MKKRKGTKKILAIILCMLMMFFNINLTTLEVKAASDTTIIDVTDLACGTEISHDCSKYLTDKYNSSQHWQECSICGKVYGNKTNHTYTDNGWTRGTANDCHPDNVHRYSCSCGYSYTTTAGKKEHVLSPVYNGASFTYYDVCYDCAESYATNQHDCIKSDGTRISCKNIGTCKICGQTYVNPLHHSTEDRNSDGRVTDEDLYKAGEDVYCYSGGEYLCHVNYNYAEINSDGHVTTHVSITVPSGFTFSSSNHFSTNHSVQLQDSVTISGTTWTNDQTVTYNGHTENTDQSRVGFWFTDENGIGGVIYIRTSIHPDNTAPVINNISQTDISTSNGWSTSKKITISGTENYCNSVNLTVKDNAGNTYINNVSTGVNNKSWSYSFVPDIEADANGKTFIVTATDAFGNSFSKSFIIYKLDKKAPVITSGNATSQIWSKTKDYTVTATDVGAGGIQIAFNNTDAYASAVQSGNNYSKKYTFTGDIYGSTTAVIYAKDAVGNEAIKPLTIYNIDNTAPTITDVSSTANEKSASVVIKANDKNAKLGKEGSGIAGYAITSTNSQPTEWSTTNNIIVTNPGLNYVWVKDNVGNISSTSFTWNPIPYTMTFHYGKTSGLTGADTQTKAVYYEKAYGNLPSPKCDGWTFNGWNTKEDGSGNMVTKDDICKGDIDVYAQWTYDPVTVSVPQTLIGDQNGNLRFMVKTAIKSGKITIDMPSGFFYSQDTKGNVYAKITPVDGNIITKDHKTAEYTVTTDGLTAGMWSGSFTIGLTLEKY